MEKKRQSSRQRRLHAKTKRKQQQVGNRLETLEERMLLAVDFIPAPLGGDHLNRPDQALGQVFADTQPAIAINPNDPGNISVANELSLLQSNNAGATFTDAGNFQTLIGDGTTATGSSDLIHTADGQLRWAGLQTDPDGSRSVGVTFEANGVLGVSSIPSQAGAQATRPIVISDTNAAADSPYAGNIYVAFVDESDNRVLLSRSVDGGSTWSDPVQVSDDSESTSGGNLPPVTPADVTVATNGDVYVAYHFQSNATAPAGPDNQSNSDGESGQVFVRRSIDGGLSFVSKTSAFPPGTADISVNVQTIDGAIDRARFFTQGARQPTILADPTREGHLYVVANDDPDNVHGSGDEGDIVFARSDDFGETWDRSTIGFADSFQVMPTAEIDQFGNIVVAWYDSQRGNLMGDQDFRLDVFVTYSTDGGSNWADAFRINDEFNPTDPVTPNTTVVFAGADRDGDGRPEDDGDETYSLGDYFGIESFGGTGYVTWNGNERVIGLPSSHQAFFDIFPIFGTLIVDGTNSDDQFLIRSMPDNADFIEVFVNGTREYAGLREALIGGIQVDGLAGNDTLVVDWTVGVGEPVPPGGIFYQGGIPEGGNQLGDTLDLLTGDREISFQSEQSDLDAGLFAVGDSPAVSFDSVERTQVGTTSYLRPDLLEVNDTFASPTVLGTVDNVTLRDLTIHDLGEGASNPDFYRMTASETGFAVVNALFDHADGDLSLVIFDSRGNAIATSNSDTDNEQIVIPVVAHETYTVQVLGVDGALNSYSLDVSNVAAPSPQAIVLDPLSDSGLANNDGITADFTPRFTVQADLSSLVAQGIAILDADQATTGDTPGAAVFVTIRDQTTGTLESGYATPVGDDIFSYGAGELPDGFLIVSASVHVFDPRLATDPADPTATVSDPAVGPTVESTPVTISLDTVDPAVTSPQLLPSSDSGMSRSDGVTNIMQPAFVGTAAPNERVRVFANGFIVGETVTGTDGRWEITVEPLTQGIYDITNQVTDLAGNFGESGIVNRIEIDKTAPNTPFLDLTVGSDTGSSSNDNVTGDNTLTFNMTTTDLPLDHLDPFNLKYRLYARPEDGSETLIYNSAEDDSIPDANSSGGFTDLEFLTATLDELPDGTHNFKLEVEDRAGNISEDFLLDVTINTSLPSALTLDLITESDTGMDNADNLTRFTNPTFSGDGDIGGRVSLFADGQLIGTGTVGGDVTNGIEGDSLGAWEITSGTLDDGVYVITAIVENENGSVSSEPLTIEVDTLQPNTPLLDLVPSSDTGESLIDNVTNSINPTFNMATIDPNQDAHVDAFNYKYRLFVRLDSGVEELVYDSSTDDTFPNSATDGTFTNLENLRRTISRALPNGTHNFKLEVEDRAGNISEDFLLNVTVDTELLTSANGITLDLLDAVDTGMDGRDNTTNINEPSFAGVAEIGSKVSLFAGGVLVGTAVAGSDDTDFVPGDGLGAWEITSLPLADGQHELIIHVEDAAGNFGRSDSLTVDVDTLAPNTPFLDLVGGTLISEGLESTTSNSLTFTMTTEDPASDDRANEFNLKYRIFLRPEGAAETLIYESVIDPSILAGNLSGGFTDLEFLQTIIGELPQGEHNFKLEVEDRAGNISDDYLLTVRIEDPVTIVPEPEDVIAVSIDLLSSSDTGLNDVDNVTKINQPAFVGNGTIGAEVRLINDQGEIIGTAIVGGDASNGILNDGLGRWEIVSAPLDDGIHVVFAEIEGTGGNTATTQTITFEVDTLAPNTPYLDLLPEDDTGLDNEDNVTFQSLPTFHMSTLDPNQDSHLDPFNYIYRLFVRLDSGVERLVYDSQADGTFPASAIQDGFVSLENLRREIDLGVPDGVHNFKLEVEDRAGNISEDFLLNVAIDTVLDAPNETITIDLVNSSDSGMSERDSVTNIETPTFAGVAEVGATVTIFANGQVVGVGTVGSDETDFVPGNGLGAWKVTSEALGDGVYEVLAHVEDLAGNFLRSNSLSVEIDTTQPNTPLLDLLNDTGHSNHDNITLSDLLEFNMTTEDPSPTGGHILDTNFKYRVFLRPEGGEEVLVYNSVVDINIDQANILEGFTDLNQLQATLGPFPDGIHNFKLEVEDRAGNISQDFLLNVQIDSELTGTPTIDMLASSDSGMFDDDNITNINQPAFTGVGEMGSTVRLRANGRLIGEAEVHSDESDGVPGNGLGEWEITSEPLDDGVYEITAEVEDWAGNVETTESVTIEVDTLQANTPYLDLIPVSDTGLHDDDNVTQVVIPTLHMATIDPNQDAHLSEFNYKYRIFVRHDSGVELLLYDSSTDQSFTASSAQGGFTSLENLRRDLDLGVPDGTHNLKLEVEDRAGNITEDFLLNVKIDTVLEAPNETINIDILTTSDTGMGETDNVTNKDQPAFTGVAEVDATVTLFADGQVIGVGRVGSDETDGVPGDGFGAWEITVEPLADGIHNVTAHVEDLAGNFLQSEAMQIEVDTRAPNTPFLDLVSSSDTGFLGRDEVTSDNTLTFNMTTTDESPDGHLIDQNYKFRLYVRPENGAEILVYNSVTDGAIPPEAIQDGLIDLNFLTTTLDELPDGEHNFKLEVEDRAGNISDDFLLNVTIDTTLVAPTIDLIASSDAGMSDSDNVTSINTPTFAGTGGVGNRVTLFADGQIVGTGFVGSDETDFISGNGQGAWQVTIDALDDGVYDVLAHIEDDAGNFQRTEPVQIEVDTLEPNTPHLDLVTLSDTGHSNHDNITGDTTPTFTFTTEDPNQDAHLNQANFKYRLFVRPEGGKETLLYTSVGDAAIDAALIDGSFTSLGFIERTVDELPDGIHNFKLEVEDRAGNISHDVTMTVEIDSTLPNTGQIDIIDASDSGMSSDDNVTKINTPTFTGLGAPGTQVRLFANGQFVGTAEVGSDESDGFQGNGFGIWEVQSDALSDGVYTMTATFEDWAGNISSSNALQIEIDTVAPNTPFLDLLEPFDSGRNDDDNITNVPTLNFSATTEDPNSDDHLQLFPGGHNLKFRIFVRPESGQETLVYDSVTDTNIVDLVDGLTSLQQILAAVDGLPEGLHNFKLEVEDRAGNISQDFLQNVLIDRTGFEGTCSLHPEGDTGIWGIDSTFGDGITGSSTPPTFTGTAEANNVVTLLIDGEIAGSTVVGPFDGDNALQDASWTIQSAVALTGGETIEIVYEDPAGNRITTTCGDGEFGLAIDTIGPRIENVTRNDAFLTSIFDPKPAGGPDPLIDSIVVHFSDGPDRDQILYDAVVQQLATEEGNYRLIGDANGDIPITSVEVLGTNPGPGIATTAVLLNFGFALPDDRYTFTVSDRIADAAGNPLDGESGANGPFEGNAGLVSTEPIFPTGDGNHGGEFLARFTVDSRPEVGVWSAGSVYVDTNGNFGFDQTNVDHVNRDITYTVGFTTDDIFAGNFAGPSGVADGYDKLAAYGRFGGWMDGTFRWWVDLDNDGVVDIDVEDPADVNGLPFAGDFDGNTVNGDEVGLYTGRTWHFDTDGDYLVDMELESELIGYPIVGDFDNDGFEDLATWADDTFMVDLANGSARGWDGVADTQFRFGFIGVRERPIAADMDQDGFDDFGLWVPDRGGATPAEAGEWYWLVSGGNSVLDRITDSLDPVRGNTQEVQFRPVPFGHDIFGQFGHEFGIPIVGNFDPPTLLAIPEVSRMYTNPVNPLDVNNDGHVSPRDALITINHLNRNGAMPLGDLAADAPFLDTSNDDFVSSLDVLRIINHLNRQATETVDTASNSVDVIADDVAQAVLAMNAADIAEDDDDENSADESGEI